MEACRFLFERCNWVTDANGYLPPRNLAPTVQAPADRASQWPLTRRADLPVAAILMQYYQSIEGRA